MNNELDINILINDIKNGNDKAFTTLYNNYKGFTRSIITTYTNNTQTINDYNQEIWVQVFRKIHLYKYDNFLAWLKKLTNNKCIDIYRRNKVKDIPTKEINDYTLYQDIPDDKEDPYIMDNILIDVFSNLATLTDRQAQILTLRIKDTPFNDIVKKLNIPHGSCTTAYHAAIIKIRRELINLGYHITKSTSLNKTNDKRKLKKKLQLNN